jgi:hypothetical protein
VYVHTRPYLGHPYHAVRRQSFVSHLIIRSQKIANKEIFFFLVHTPECYTTSLKPSNVSTAGLGPRGRLPPLFRWRLRLPCVVLRRFPLSRVAGRRTDSLHRGFFVRRVAQRGQFALGVGCGGVGCFWHGIMYLRNFVRRVAQRGRFMLRIGRGGVGCFWHGIAYLHNHGVVRGCHGQQGGIDNGCGRRGGRGRVGRREGDFTDWLLD